MTDTMQALVDGLGAQWMRERAETQMTFGQLIDRLAQLPPDMLLAASKPHSYRGYYSDVAIDPTEWPSTAGSLLAECREMMGRTMTGYKGGEYPVHENVPVWVAPYGCCGNKLMSIGDDGALNTEEEE